MINNGNRLCGQKERSPLCKQTLKAEIAVPGAPAATNSPVVPKATWYRRLSLDLIWGHLICRLHWLSSWRVLFFFFEGSCLSFFFFTGVQSPVLHSSKYWLEGGGIAPGEIILYGGGAFHCQHNKLCLGDSCLQSCTCGAEKKRRCLTRVLCGNNTCASSFPFTRDCTQFHRRFQ